MRHHHGPRTREACGCIHDGFEWLVLCAPHQEEFARDHARALLEHRLSTSPAPLGPSSPAGPPPTAAPPQNAPSLTVGSSENAADGDSDLDWLRL